MVEKTYTISAGGTPIYEIVYDPDGGTTVTVRDAEGVSEQRESIKLLASVIPTLVDALTEVHGAMS